jgi:hypothetical protein
MNFFRVQGLALKSMMHASTGVSFSLLGKVNGKIILKI